MLERDTAALEVAASTILRAAAPRKIKIPFAMSLAGFKEEESKNSKLQMRVRRGTPPKNIHASLYQRLHQLARAMDIHHLKKHRKKETPATVKCFIQFAIQDEQATTRDRKQQAEVGAIGRRNDQTRFYKVDFESEASQGCSHDNAKGSRPKGTQERMTNQHCNR
jgi:hypothetical protein